MPETIEYKGYTINIMPDDSPENPRTWDNLGTMVCWHRRTYLGDTTLGNQNGKIAKDVPFFENMEALLEIIHRKDVLSLPLYLYEHGGMTMNTTGYHDHWDSGQVGYIYVERATIQKEFGVKRLTQKVRNRVLDILQNEVEVYDQYLTGDVYGYTIHNPEGEEESSIWGYFGQDFCKEEAKSEVDSMSTQRQAKLWAAIPQ